MRTRVSVMKLSAHQFDLFSSQLSAISTFTKDLIREFIPKPTVYCLYWSPSHPHTWPPILTLVFGPVLRQYQMKSIFTQYHYRTPTGQKHLSLDQSLEQSSDFETLPN
ncbi:hypothetical protein OCU04_000796 [Sclerotinia nivalis]|uniref:Uncharacterized protein n=1 Tax=Sclerotinia nivalis TaxID=352851 RepID=A0A9X0AWU9_9HELO|nr:hypothetical protein OCU04_000796 [Sclerotinia nivalis]